MVGGTPCALWLSDDSLCDYMIWDKREGVLTGQPVGTAIIAAIVSANRVDLGSFISRCYAFRRTHTSADPIRLLCIQLPLPLTLSLPSRLVPSPRLTVDVPPRALWLAGIFLRRKKRCAGVVGTHIDWVLKGEGGGWRHHCCSTLHGVMGEARLSGLGGKVTRRVSRDAPCLSDSRLHLLRQAASN